MSDPHILAAKDLVFAYELDRPVLRGVSLTAAAGKLLCVLGPNGSGKTTLLRCLLGQLSPAGGEIRLDDKPLGRYSRRGLARLMAYVPQTPRSAFAFTVQELVLMGRLSHTGLLGLVGKHDLAVSHQAMRMTGVAELADRTLEELSGGEAQCAMVARALAQQPSVMMLDEPTSHLDLRNQLLVHRMMQRLAHDWGMAVVCISHDVNLAARFADELMLMRAGVVVAAGEASAVIREDLLEQTYDVKVELIPTGEAVPVVRAK
jgi:iron complex transport system ATP-binding protein